MIEVERRGEQGEVVTVVVRVREDGSETTHEVTVRARDLAKLGRPSESPESFVRRSFEFLLAREPKEAILSSFDVTVIGRYFPEFERAIRG